MLATLVAAVLGFGLWWTAFDAGFIAAVVLLSLLVFLFAHGWVAGVTAWVSHEVGADYVGPRHKQADAGGGSDRSESDGGGGRSDGD